MAKRKPKYHYSLACDDIREEVGNKLSFMGVYGKNIVIPKTPFVFPQICVAIFCKDLSGGDIFSIKAVDPSGKEIGKLINGNISKDTKGYVDMTLFAKFTPVKISKEGSLRLEIRFNDDESTKTEIEIPVSIRK